MSAAIPAGVPTVVIDGADGGAALSADWLSTAVRTGGRPCVRLHLGPHPIRPEHPTGTEATRS